MNVETELYRSRRVRKAMSLIEDRKKVLADEIEALGFQILNPSRHISHRIEALSGYEREILRLTYYRALGSLDLGLQVRPMDLSYEEIWHVITPEETEELGEGTTYTTEAGEVLWSEGGTWYVNSRRGSLVELVRAHLESEKEKLETSAQKVQDLLEGLPS